MKKMLKAAAVLAAAMMVMGFASCSNGDDAEDLGTLLLIKDAQEKAEAAAKENTSSSSAAGAGESEAATVNAKWDFSVASLTAAGLTVDGVKPSAEKEIAVASGSGATLNLLAQTGKTIKIRDAASGGFSVGTGSAETEVLSITTTDACTLKFIGYPSSGTKWVSSKPNSFSVGGSSVYVCDKAEDQSKSPLTWTYTISKAGTYKIAVSGMVFTALVCE